MAAVLLLPLSLLGQSSGTVSTAGVSGLAGNAVNIPVSLSLKPGVSVDTLAFGVSVLANGSAPAVSGLQFTQDPSLPKPLTDNKFSPNAISIVWTSPLKPTLSGTQALGVVTMTIPALAVNGQSTYALRVTGASGALGNNSVVLVPGNDTTLTVGSTAPAIALNPSSLTFTAQAGGANPGDQSILVSNSGGGTLNWTAFTNGASWLSLTQASGTGNGTVIVSANISGLGAGNYSGAVQVSATGATDSPQTIGVTLTVSAPPPPPAIGLNLTSLTFTAQQGGASPGNQSVNIFNSGGGTLNWTAAVTSGSSWLSASPASGSNGGTLVVSVNASSLSAGSYSGAIQVSASGVANSPQTITVALTVTAAATPPAIALNPPSLTFNAAVGGTNPATQAVTITNSGGGTLTWTTSVTSGAWLSVSPGSGSTSGTAASPLTIGVNVSGLSAGTLTGSIQVAAAGASNTPQTVAVTLVLAASGATTIVLSPASLPFTAASGTNPATQTFQISNSTGTGSLGWTAVTSEVSGGTWLTVSPMTGVAPSTVTVSVSSASLAPGLYQGSVIVQASASSNATNPTLTLPVFLAVGAPTISANGVVNGASFSTNAVVSPGSIASLFGVNLAPSAINASTVPLPTTLMGTQVLVLGKPVPLFFVSPTQINFQMPAEATGSAVPVVVVWSGVTSSTATANLAPAVPGIFTTGSSGSGQAAALNQDNSANSAQNPAAAGSIVQIFATGLGATNPPAATGQPGGAAPNLNLTATPVVMIGGLPATVSFSGLAPGYIGLYQVNAQVPLGLSSSAATTLQIQINGQTSNTVTIAVR